MVQASGRTSTREAFLNGNGQCHAKQLYRPLADASFQWRGPDLHGWIAREPQVVFHGNFRAFSTFPGELPGRFFRVVKPRVVRLLSI